MEFGFGVEVLDGIVTDLADVAMRANLKPWPCSRSLCRVKVRKRLLVGLVLRDIVEVVTSPSLLLVRLRSGQRQGRRMLTLLLVVGFGCAELVEVALLSIGVATKAFHPGPARRK